MPPWNKPATKKRQTIRPRVEALENREVPAVVITKPGQALPASTPPLPAGVVASSPGVLLIDNRSTSSSSTTNVTITDNGSGTLTVSTGGAAGAAIPNIHRIEYLASLGTDNFQYKMTTPGTPLNEDMRVDVYLPTSATTPPPSTLKPLSGNKQFSATFGLLATPFVPASAGTAAKGGTLAAHVNVTGHLAIRIHGSPVVDNASLAYAGTVTGRLDVLYDEPFPPAPGFATNQDGDKITYSVQLTGGSTGQVFPRMIGGPGPDLLTLLVQKRVASDTVRIHGAHAVNGGGSGTGLNNCVIGGPITAINC
jgi:hypothetical protein